MDAIKRLEKRKKALVHEAWAIQSKIDNEKTKQQLPVLSKQYLGKCFTFRNSYSGSKYWNVYYFVYAVDDRNTATCFEFQTDPSGQSTIVPKANVYFDMLQSQIPYALFAKAYAKLLKHIDLKSAGKPKP